MNFAMLKKVYRVVSLESLTSEHFSGDWRVFRQISEFNTLPLLSYSVGKATQILCVKYMCMTWKPPLLPFESNFSSADYPAALRRFPFFRTIRPDPSRRNENFTINQNYPARSVKSSIVCKKKMVFQQKTLWKSRFDCWNDRKGPSSLFI